MIRIINEERFSKSVDADRIKFLKALTPMSAVEYYRYETDGVDMDVDNVDRKSYQISKEALGSGPIYTFSCDDEDGVYSNLGLASDYMDVFEPMQYPDFYPSSVSKIIHPGDMGGSTRTLIKSSIGNIIQEGGGGYSWIAMNVRTMKNLIKYLQTKLSNMTKITESYSNEVFRLALKFIQNAPSMSADRFYALEEESFDFDDPYDSEYEVLERTKKLLGTGEIYTFSMDDVYEELYEYNTSVSYDDLFMAMIQPDFYPSASIETLRERSEFLGDRRVINSSIGSIVTDNTDGYVWVAMNARTRQNLIKYLQTKV
jgi:hypothetical protein